jgi:hypothetical protein
MILQVSPQLPSYLQAASRRCDLDRDPGHATSLKILTSPLPTLYAWSSIEKMFKRTRKS